MKTQTEVIARQAKLIAFAVKYAAESVDLAKFTREQRVENGEDPDEWHDTHADCNLGFGHMQSLRMDFEGLTCVEVQLFSDIFRESSKAIAKASDVPVIL